MLLLIPGVTFFPTPLYLFSQPHYIFTHAKDTMRTHSYFTNNYSEHFEFSITTGCTLISVRRQEFSSEEFSESGGVLLLTLWASPGYGLVGYGGTWNQNTRVSLSMGSVQCKVVFSTPLIYSSYKTLHLTSSAWLAEIYVISFETVLEILPI